MSFLQKALADMDNNIVLPSEKLDLARLSPEVEKLQFALLSKIIGQERAVKQIISGYIPTTVNMHRDSRPLGVYLFLGPTGVGKSETVKQFARYLLGKPTSLTKIDCNEFQQEHEVSKLIGAPPGYVGFHDEENSRQKGKMPRLHQKEIDRYQTKDTKVNIVLFDEIEKADPRLFDAILSILGDGVLTLGNGEKTDFSRTFIFFTSNLGSSEIRQLLRGEGIGFQKEKQESKDIDNAIYKVSKKAVEKKFKPEFLNRVDKLIVFRPLEEISLRLILKNELRDLQWRVFRAPFKGWDITSKEPTPARQDVNFRVTRKAEDFLIKEGTSEIYGARELNRAVDKFVGLPLASLISSGQLKHGDHVEIDYTDGMAELDFVKKTLVQ